MIDSSNFQFNNIITIQPYILQEHLKVRDSKQCLQIIARYLNSTLHCESKHVTQILKQSRNQLSKDDREGIIKRFQSLVDKTDYESELRYLDSDIHSIIEWVINEERVDLKQFIYLIDIVQILINTLGQHEVDENPNWIKELFIGSQSYFIIQDIFKVHISKKAMKSPLNNLILNNKDEFIQDKSPQFQNPHYEVKDEFKQIQHEFQKQGSDASQRKIDELKKEKDILLYENEDLHEQIFYYQQDLRQSKLECSALEKEVKMLKEQMQKASKNQFIDNEDFKMNRQGLQELKESRSGRLQVQGLQPQRSDSQINKGLKRQPQLPIRNSPMKLNGSKRVGLYEQTLIGLDKKKQ